MTEKELALKIETLEKEGKVVKQEIILLLKLITFLGLISIIIVLIISIFK